jgi:hypothetical protein
MGIGIPRLRTDEVRKERRSPYGQNEEKALAWSWASEDVSVMCAGNLDHGNCHQAPPSPMYSTCLAASSWTEFAGRMYHSKTFNRVCVSSYDDPVTWFGVCPPPLLPDLAKRNKLFVAAI